MSMSTGVSACSGAEPGVAWGRAPLGPKPTMGAKLSSSAPPSRKSLSSIQATSRSLMPGARADSSAA